MPSAKPAPRRAPRRASAGADGPALQRRGRRVLDAATLKTASRPPGRHATEPNGESTENRTGRDSGARGPRRDGDEESRDGRRPYSRPSYANESGGERRPRPAASGATSLREVAMDALRALERRARDVTRPRHEASP